MLSAQCFASGRCNAVFSLQCGVFFFFFPYPAPSPHTLLGKIFGIFSDSPNMATNGVNTVKNDGVFFFFYGGGVQCGLGGRQGGWLVR